jgi:hypothetical protein
MKIEFELTKEDYINFNLYHFCSSAAQKRSITIQRYILPLVVVAAPFITTGFSSLPSRDSLLFVTIFYAIWVAFYLKYYKWRLARWINKNLDKGKNKGILGEHSILFSDTEIVEVNDYNEMKTQWDGVEGVVETKDYIYIYNSAVTAYIIPIRAFVSMEAKEEFRKYLTSVINNYNIENKIEL